jgi:hypothetical protein
MYGEHVVVFCFSVKYFAFREHKGKESLVGKVVVDWVARRSFYIKLNAHQVVCRFVKY